MVEAAHQGTGKRNSGEGHTNTNNRGEQRVVASVVVSVVLFVLPRVMSPSVDADGTVWLRFHTHNATTATTDD